MGNKNSRSAVINSRVVPFIPRFGEAGPCGVVFDSTGVVEVETDGCMEEVCVVSVGKVFGKALEGDEESEDLENNP